MKYTNVLAGSLVICALATGPWHQVMASTYFGHVCLVFETTDQPPTLEATLKIGLDHMGDQHFTVSGALDPQTPDDHGLRPVNGNIENVDGVFLMNLLSSWPEGNDIYHLRLSKDTFEGTYSRIRTEAALGEEPMELISKYANGTVFRGECAVIEPGSTCDDLRIPPGHLPPRGSCRIWHPDLPPGQQRPPVACNEQIGDVPLGACLIDQYGLVVEVGG
jgi:hypothetical protein